MGAAAHIPSRSRRQGVLVSAIHPPAGVTSAGAAHSGAAHSGATYYRDRDVQVTQRWLVTRETRYAVAELGNIGVDREACAPSGVFAGVLAIVAMLAFTVGVSAGSVPVAIAGGIGALLGLGVAGTAWRLRRFQLWATYRGTDICLYRSLDETRFGKITRALLRARR
jgi:hypothetical protein